ncbi:MAG: asparagine synthase (glutamine-hydrolyzing) [Crocinitomicaceae bacterium]|nr:asparagine synthase (glutamine-hydrolyzing) [Crocinitomicaceae bacterium]
MCGINGIYRFNGFADDGKIISTMNDTIKHRGPDAEGVYKDELVHLGHRRLSIIDVEERSNQPFISQDGRYAMVFNGEIYNFWEIRAELTDYNFITDSDTEVVLAAYLKWSESALERFNGMFAFAIWDKHTKELFIARDRLGIKPLYYFLSDDEIVFSSSVKSILSTGLIDKKIRPDSLIDYLRFQTVHAPFTLIESVMSLMPGQYLRINELDGIQFKTYWNPISKAKMVFEDLEVTKSKVREGLTKSVERRLVADVPFGAFLSGGIDSSIVVGLMSQIHSQKVDTFSIVFKEDQFSERVFAKMIADKFNTDHHEIELSVDEFKEMIPTALSLMDHPSGDGLNTFVVSKKTREAGVKMALSGLGGDELFAGYSIFRQVRELQQKTWLKSFPAYARKPFANLYHTIKGDVASKKIAELLKQEYFDMEYIYQFYRQTLMDDQIKKLVNVQPLPLNQSFKIAHDLVGYNTAGWNLPSLSRISVAEISTYMQNVLLRDADQMSMANSLEVRVPFLDHELVEYVMGIPDKHKFPKTPKQLLVSSFEDLLPREVYDREKMGFVLPYEKWMKEDLRSFCSERLEELKKLRYFKADQLDKLWNEFLSGNKRVTWSRIWPLVVLGDWIKTNEVRH